MTINGLLLDLEGVLYQGDGPIPDVAEAVGRLAASGIKIGYLTNTTTQPRRAIVKRLQAMGFVLKTGQLFTPGIAAARLLKQRGVTRIHLAAPAVLAEDLAECELVEDQPEAVILGDLYKGFTWDRLDGLFKMLQQGAKLVALHKNRYCRRGAAIALDLGPFVAALDYATGSTAEIVGKPSPLFFRLALEEIGLAAADAAMVGDDIEADIGGAQAVGMATIQVRTGKFTAKDLDHPSIRPAHRIGSAADLAELLLAGF